MKLKRPGRPADQSLPERRREEILAAATRLFAERGYSDTDTQLLADRLEVGKGTLYRYFPTKCELFLACADRCSCRTGGRRSSRWWRSPLPSWARLA